MSSPSLKPPAAVRWLSILIVLAALLVRFWPHPGDPSRVPAPPAVGAAASSTARAPSVAPEAVLQSRDFGERVGFRTSDRLEAHFRKHGREFGATSAAEYLRMAQALRDRPYGGPVLQIVRDDGVVTRFDRASGAFIAFGSDGVIRTFFKPGDGERYFQRQATLPHGGP